MSDVNSHRTPKRRHCGELGKRMARTTTTRSESWAQPGKLAGAFNFIIYYQLHIAPPSQRMNQNFKAGGDSGNRLPNRSCRAPGARSTRLQNDPHHTEVSKWRLTHSEIYNI